MQTRSDMTGSRALEEGQGSPDSQKKHIQVLVASGRKKQKNGSRKAKLYLSELEGGQSLLSFPDAGLVGTMPGTKKEKYGVLQEEGCLAPK